MDKRTVKTSRLLVDDSWCCIEYEEDKVLEVREKSDLVPDDDCERCGSTLIVGEKCTARYSDGDVYIAHMIYEADEKEQCIKFKLDEERKRKLDKAKGKKKTQNAQPVSKNKKRKGNENQETTKKKRKSQETPKGKPLQEKSTNNQPQAKTTSTTRKKEIKEFEKQQILAREKSAQELAYSMFNKINKHDTNSTACVSDSLNDQPSMSLPLKGNQSPSLNDKLPMCLNGNRSPSVNGNHSASLNCNQSLSHSTKSESRPLNSNHSPSLNCNQSLSYSIKSDSRPLNGRLPQSQNCDQSLSYSTKSESRPLNGNLSQSENCDQSLSYSTESESQPVNCNLSQSQKCDQSLSYSTESESQPVNCNLTQSQNCNQSLSYSTKSESQPLNGNLTQSQNCDQSLSYSTKSESRPLNGILSRSQKCDESLSYSTKSESRPLNGSLSQSQNCDQSLSYSTKSESRPLNGNLSRSQNCDQSLSYSTKSESRPLNGSQIQYLNGQSAPSGSGDSYNPSIIKVPYQPIAKGHGFQNHGFFSADHVQPRNVFSTAQLTQHQNAFQHQPIYPQLNFGPNAANYPYFSHSATSPFMTNNVHGDNACKSPKDSNNVGKLMSSSFSLLENENSMFNCSSVTENNSSDNIMDDDVDNDQYVACPISKPSELMKPQSPACNNQCLDCLKKDKEIADLKMRLYNLGPSEGEIISKNKKYKPKTRPETKTGDYMVIAENSVPPAGFQLLAPEATIAVRPLWLEETVALVGENRDRQNKKAIKKGRKVKTNFNSEIVKKLMDGFFDPEELAVAGGTGAFKGNAIFESIKLYANHCLSVDTATFHVYWREKMSSSSQTLQRRRKNGKKDRSEIETESN